VADLTAPSRLGRRPALDGVRGAAWAVVFVSHAVSLPLALGQVAMFVFFALSGFLITGLLVEEHTTTGAVSLRNFFARRALRLLPALLLFLVVWFAVVLVLQGHAPWTATVPGGGSGAGTSAWVGLQGVAAAIAYVSNWAQSQNWFTGYVPLGHLWSLAVEEQFYLLWSPVAVLLLARCNRRVVGWVAGFTALASFVDVALRDGHGLSITVDMGTDTRAGAFLVGAVLAVAWSRRARWVRALQAAGGRYTVTAALLCLAWGSWGFHHQLESWVFTATWVGVSLASGILVVAFLGEGRRHEHRIVSSPVATYVGRRSYGLYLWHYVWLTWLASMGLLGVPMALLLSFASAEASWRCVERRALAHKRRFGPGLRVPLREPVVQDSADLVAPAGT
jgi:peptidoglycan/LPS O-acetylase OafA/YrhL